jgi:aldose 1-epimerase|tara:strand:+ start:3460 stop:3759 length:300 start_codon:yes stop_codon:yes gene_type:complete
LDEQLSFGGGYDHNYVLNKSNRNVKEVSFAAKVCHPKSGRMMEVYTDEPGIQFYSGNSLNGTVVGKNGIPYQSRYAFLPRVPTFSGYSQPFTFYNLIGK